MDLVESAISKSSSARHPWELARSKVIFDLIQEHLPELIDAPTEVLDIGCGDSWLIEQLSYPMKKAHFTAVDTAFSDELIESYERKFDPNRFHFGRDLKKSIEGKDQIDLILLLDVIEHIENEVNFLNKICVENQAINSQSMFLITVPAFQSLFCAHDEFLGHYRRYTNDSLKVRLEAAGMEVINAGYFFSSLLLPRGIIKLLESSGLKSKEVKGIGDHKAGKADGLIRSILFQDYQLGKAFRSLGINLIGLSNFAIARPKKDLFGK